jgi:hypothetical protein
MSRLRKQGSSFLGAPRSNNKHAGFLFSQE